MLFTAITVCIVIAAILLIIVVLLELVGTVGAQAHDVLDDPLIVGNSRHRLVLGGAR